MFNLKLTWIISATLLITLASGCGSTGPVVREDAPVDHRQAIIDTHEQYANQERQILRDKQQQEAAAAGDGSAAAKMQAELDQAQKELREAMESGQEEARSILEGGELASRMTKLDDEYRDELEKRRKEITEKYEGAGEEEAKRFETRQQMEFEDLEKRLKEKLDMELAAYDEEQRRVEAKHRDEELTRELATRRRAQEEAPGWQPQAQPQPGPAPGTKAPVEPVVTRRPPPMTDKGLRREGNAPLGQRRYYANKPYGTGEAQYGIRQSTELGNREDQELILTFWMEGSQKSAIPRFRLNGVLVRSWQELETRLAAERKKLIDKHHQLYAKVILDQRKDVPRSVVDDILTVCFRVGIKKISMGPQEPLMEQ